MMECIHPFELLAGFGIGIFLLSAFFLIAVGSWGRK